MIFTDIDVILPRELNETMFVIGTAIIPKYIPWEDDYALLLMGDNVHFHDESKEVVIKVYTLKRDGTEYFIDEEINTFEFYDLDVAVMFLEDLPEMSAFELIIHMQSMKEEKIKWGNVEDETPTDEV